MIKNKQKLTQDFSRAQRWVGFVATGGLVLSIVAILLAIFSALGTKWEWWEFKKGLGFFKDSFFLGLGGLALSTVTLGLCAILKGRVSRAVAGFFLGLFFCGYLFTSYRAARSAPPIHDITTDTQNPPAFVAILPLRKAALNPPEYGGADIAAQQQKVYPDIQPLVLNQPPAKAFSACLAAAQKMGWTLAEGKESEGRLEATDQTFWFGFKDDVVVRVKPEGQGSRIDIRSVSRVGRGDVGTNARRIRRFLAKVKETS